MKVTMQEELGEASREDNHGATKHLPDRGSDPKKTDVHHSSGAHIAKSREAHKAVLFPDRDLRLGLLALLFRVDKRLVLGEIAVLLCLGPLDATHDLVHNKTAEHTNEHSLGLEPGLLELVIDAVLTVTPHRKDKLLYDNGAGTEEQHTCNHNTCHITHLLSIALSINFVTLCQIG